jgi:hypothetical protein
MSYDANIIRKKNIEMEITKASNIVHTGYVLDIKSILDSILKTIPEQYHESVKSYTENNTIYVAHMYRDTQQKMRRWFIKEKTINADERTGFIKSYYFFDDSTEKKVRQAIIAKINIHQIQYYLVLSKSPNLDYMRPHLLKLMAPRGELGQEQLIDEDKFGSSKIVIKYDPYVYTQ